MEVGTKQRIQFGLGYIVRIMLYLDNLKLIMFQKLFQVPTYYSLFKFQSLMLYYIIICYNCTQFIILPQMKLAFFIKLSYKMFDSNDYNNIQLYFKLNKSIQITTGHK